MSVFIDNNSKKKELLKHLIKQLHEGKAPEAVRAQLVRLLGEVPYDLVVQVEQELIAEGLPTAEVLKLCDVHTAAMKGAISQKGARTAPPGHPVHTFLQENKQLASVVVKLKELFIQLQDLEDDADAGEMMMQIRGNFNRLMDVEKHYVRKENLVFPYLEKKGITGPPTVMWGKHDETRGLLKTAIEVFEGVQSINAAEAKSVLDLLLRPAATAVDDMIYKEEQILFPMSLDEITESEWYQIYRQSTEIGFCLYDPIDEWKPAITETTKDEDVHRDKIRLSSGSFTPAELTAMLNTIPFDITFVDKDDTVRYFSQGNERIFERSRAIIGRKVQLCHPPSSVHIVQKILNDFKSGAENKASFWINIKGSFIMIEYFALRGENGEYLGTVEVSQNLSEKRELQGERRLLKYESEK